MNYEQRVRELEATGCTRSDAQSVADAEALRSMQNKAETYSEAASRALPVAAGVLAGVLLRIYEADRTRNCGVVNGEAVLSQSFRLEAQHALKAAGIVVQP